MVFRTFQNIEDIECCLFNVIDEDKIQNPKIKEVYYVDYYIDYAFSVDNYIVWNYVSCASCMNCRDIKFIISDKFNNLDKNKGYLINRDNIYEFNPLFCNKFLGEIGDILRIIFRKNLEKINNKFLNNKSMIGFDFVNEYSIESNPYNKDIFLEEFLKNPSLDFECLKKKLSEFCKSEKIRLIKEVKKMYNSNNNITSEEVINEDEKKLYIKDSILKEREVKLKSYTYDDFFLSIDKNVITFDKKLKFELDKNVNEYFSFDNLPFINKHFGDFKYMLIDMKINHKNFEDDELRYEIKFEENKTLINNVSVPSSKIRSILNKISNYTYEETIKKLPLLINLTYREFSVLNVEYLRFGYDDINEVGTILKIPFSINVNSKYKFDIVYLGNSYNIDKDTLLKLFYNGLDRTPRYYHRINVISSFNKSLGIDKKYFYDYLQKLAILNSLKGSNQDEN